MGLHMCCVERLRSNMRLPQTSARLQSQKMCVYVWLLWLVRRYQHEALHRASCKYVLNFGLLKAFRV
jgi:hypothetical protein